MLRAARREEMPTGRSGRTLGEHTEKHPDQFNKAVGGWEIAALKGSLAWERGTLTIRHASILEAVGSAGSNKAISCRLRLRAGTTDKLRKPTCKERPTTA